MNRKADLIGRLLDDLDGDRSGSGRRFARETRIGDPHRRMPW
jgi:hypothetical protein